MINYVNEDISKIKSARVCETFKYVVHHKTSEILGILEDCCPANSGVKSRHFFFTEMQFF